MGDRALVLFTDGRDVSPTTYLHQMGSQVPQRLAEHKELMRTRTADVAYAAARFLGICHSMSDGNLSLGCWNTPPDVEADVLNLIKEDAPTELPALDHYTHGDAGVVIVDVRDFTWKAFGGYLAKPAGP